MHNRCPHCKKIIRDTWFKTRWAALGGQVTSRAKTRAAQENGRLGGRPPNPRKHKVPTVPKPRGRPRKVQLVENN